MLWEKEDITSRKNGELGIIAAEEIPEGRHIMDLANSAPPAVGAGLDAVQSTNLTGCLGDLTSKAGKTYQENIVDLTMFCNLIFSLTEKAFPDTKDSFEDSYDYIIVGGGPGGSVLANRLTEKPCVSVLLLEAGGKAPKLTEIPSFARVFYNTDIDWLYQTVPQEHGAFSQVDQKVNWNSGKALGGGSVINAMLYVRGNKKNYNEWAEQGATGWSYKDVLPYFLKMENNEVYVNLDAGYHNRSGPLNVETARYNPEIKQPIIRALKKYGFKLRDINGEKQTGIYDPQATMRNWTRCSAAKAYLVPADERPNLTILDHAFARKIIFDGITATGVEFDFKGKTHTVKARREVIISSGTVRAPQILMLSGIGPKDQLDKLGIPVIKDLPGVGQNLQDHGAANVNFEIDPTIQNVVVKNLRPDNVLKYRNERKGPMTCPDEVNVMLFSDGINSGRGRRDFPRQELYFAEYVVTDALAHYNIDPVVYAEVFGKYTQRATYTCIISQLQPYSRGEIRLNSTDPYDYPLIDPKYYEDERDLWDVVKGMEICAKVGASEELKAVKAKIFDTVYPNCADKTGNQTEYFACQAKQVITSFWHPVGTCKMGNPEDKMTVVDPELKVIGVNNLRVVCAAIMPIIPSGNTNVPTMMISEKIADVMKKDIAC